MSRLLALLLIVKVKNDFSLVARTRQRSTPRGKNQGTHQRARKNLSLTRSRGASYIAPKVAARATLPPCGSRNKLLLTLTQATV
jgi:hypothetical protein